MTNKYNKHKDYGHVYCEDMLSPVVRGGWPALKNPKKAPDPKPGQERGAPRFEITLFMPKNDPAVQAYVSNLEPIAAGGVAFYNEGQDTKIALGSLFGKYGDGDSPKYNAEKYPFVKGCWVVAVRNRNQPQFVDKDKKPIGPEAIKGGMLVRVVMSPMITAKGLSFKLNLIQLVKDDGKYFAGGLRDATDLLDDITSDDSHEEESTNEAEQIAAKEVATKAVQTEQQALQLETPKQETAVVTKALPKGGKGKANAVNLLA